MLKGLKDKRSKGLIDTQKRKSLLTHNIEKTEESVYK